MSPTNPRQSRTVQDSNRAAARSAVSNQPSGLLLSPRFPIFRNVYQEGTACRSTVCTASVGRYRTRTAAESTTACGGNREARLGPRSNFSRPCQGLRKNWQAQLEGGAAGQAISPVGCCLARGSQSSGMSTVGDCRFDSGAGCAGTHSCAGLFLSLQPKRPLPAAETGS